MNRVLHFEIQADDVERAIKFYKSALGWEITKWQDDESGIDYWMIKTGDSGPGINGGLYKRPENKNKFFHLFDCTVGVADLDQAIKSVKASGGKITGKKIEIPKIGWFALAEDTEGNRFALMQATDWQPK